MAKPSLTLRTTKGSALTFTEADTNLTNLRDATVSVSAGGSTTALDLNGTLTVANSATVQASISGSTLTLQSNITPGPTFANTATVGTSVSGGTTSISLITAGTAGSYINVTTDVYGRVTSGSNTLSANVAGNGQYIDTFYISNYREKVANVGPFTGSLSINANTAPVQTGAVTGSFTLNSSNITNLQPGKSLTLLLYHTGNYTLTSDLKFIGGNKAISTTAGNVDALTVFYDGTTYLASVAKYF